MSAAYARKSIIARIDGNISDSSSKESDGKFLQEACSISDYPSVEFKYTKSRMESKYGFKFKDYYKRIDVVEEWNKIKDSLCVTNEEKGMFKKSSTSTKPKKLKTIKDNDWGNSCKDDWSPTEALERFYKLKAEEKRKRLLEEVRNVELL